MHANTRQLIAIRDRDLVDGEVRQHVEGCEHCRRRIEELGMVRAALRALPQEMPPEGAWERVLEARRMEARPRPGGQLLAATVAAFSVAIIAVFGMRLSLAPAPEDARAQDAQLVSLQRQSQDLERLLQQYRKPVVMSVRSASTVGELEDSIALIDYRLSLPGISSEERRALWSQRVALMESLVTVRTVEHIAGGI